MNELRNPYIAGAPVVETSMFFGREDIFNWIENNLTGKFVDHILVLHGQRRVGKTSVLKQIPNFLSEQYIQIFFDLQGRTNTTLDRFLWWMASEIIRTLNKKTDGNLPRPSRDQFIDPDNFISEFILKLQPQLEDHTLLLTFDEFDTLDRVDIQDSLARPLISFLRRLFEVKGLNFIFSIGSSGSKLENMQASYTDFFKTALYRKVSFLTKDDCHNLITKPVEGVLSYSSDAITHITEITSGHPYFTQLTCHELFSQCQKTGDRIITYEDVEAILDDVIERGTVNLKFVWDEATNLEKWILAALAMTEGLSLKNLIAVLKSQGVRFVDSDLNSAILHLQDKDVLTQDNHLVVYLMKLWLERNRPMDRVREELIETNPIADRYIEIGDEYQERGQWEDALNSYQQALAVQTNNLAALINIGVIYLDQENYQLAAASFQKALQVDNEHIAARQGFCQAQLSLGDQARKANAISDTIDAYQAILNIIPIHQEARQRLSETYKEQAETFLSNGDDQKALEQLHLAMELMPEDETLKARHQGIINEKKVLLIKSWMDKADRALKRKRWDEASLMADEALKVDHEDHELLLRVAQVKDAPRQEKLHVYRLEAENAIARGDYSKAIMALETAVLLAPEDTTLADWLETTRYDQQHAQIKMHQIQAKKAEAAGDWEAAITAWKTALKLNPDNEELTKALSAAQAAQHFARLKSLREKVTQARREERWDNAVTAAQTLLELTPEDTDLQIELETLQTAKHQAALEALLKEAEKAAAEENWNKAVCAWEDYLEEVPEEKDKLVDRIAHARKYARISADYVEAQEHLRKKQYNRAISKLQSIITQDPTYKATSRLLTEAVEGSRQQKPIWKRHWLVGAAGVLIIIIIGLIFREEFMGFLTSFSRSDLFQNNEQQGNELTPLAENGEGLLQDNQSQSVFNTAFFQDDDAHIYLLEHLRSHSPIFFDDFSKANQDWGITSEGIQISSLIQDDQLVIPDHFDGSGELPDIFTAGVSFSIPQLDFTEGFLLAFNFAGNDQIESLNLLIGLSLTGDKGYQISIKNHQWELTQILDNTLVGQGNLNGSPSDTSSNLAILIVKGSFAQLIINDESVFEFDDLPRENFLNRIEVIASEAGGVICFDNFQLWDLEGVDLLPHNLDTGITAIWDTVHAVMDSQPTSFEDDFSEANPLWDDYWSDSGGGSLDTLLNDGHLSIPDAAGEFGFPIPVQSKDFIAAIEMSPQEDYDIFNFSFREIDSPESWYVVSLHGRDGEFSIDYRDETIPESVSNLHHDNFGALDGEKLYTLIVIAKEEEFAVFWMEENNEELLYYLDQAIIDGSSLSFYIRSESDAVMNIDTIKFWDLTGVDFDSLVTQSGESQPKEVSFEEIISSKPTWMDDFSTTNADWGTVVSDKLGEHPLSDLLKAEMLVFPASSNTQHFRIPVDGSDFILSLEITPQESFGSFMLEFRIEDDPLPTGYRFSISNPTGQYSIESFEKATGLSTELAYGNLQYFENLKSYLLMVIVKDDNLIISWDGSEIFANDQATLRGTDNHLTISNHEETGTILHIDNIRFWNLEDVEINLETEQEVEIITTSPTPDWVTDFAEPILSEITDIPPTFEDTFTSKSDVWKIIADWRITVHNGEMFIQGGKVINQHITFYDYVIKVHLRTIEPGDHGISFNNGSMVECEFNIDQYNNARAGCDGSFENEIISTYTQNKNNFDMWLIVKDSMMAFFIDGKPLAFMEDDGFRLYRGENLEVGLYSWTSQAQGDPIAAAFSNFRIWNITNLELSQ